MRHRHLSLLCSTTLLGLVSIAMPRQTGGLVDLLGQSPDQIIERFGVPRDAIASSTAIEFVYDATGGGEGRFTFCDDAAVRVPGADFVPAKVSPPPADRAYSGQRVALAALRLGNPESVRHGTSSTSLHYPDGTEATVRHGRVLIHGER
ncbi:MAG: hypothetical protein KDE27_00975 [Planctomycetes bacterium]|nr:hypothetical protein [Planctomycetota bacterium]